MFHFTDSKFEKDSKTENPMFPKTFFNKATAFTKTIDVTGKEKQTADINVSRGSKKQNSVTVNDSAKKIFHASDQIDSTLKSETKLQSFTNVMPSKPVLESLLESKSSKNTLKHKNEKNIVDKLDSFFTQNPGFWTLCLIAIVIFSSLFNMVIFCYLFQRSRITTQKIGSDVLEAEAEYPQCRCLVSRPRRFSNATV